MKLKFEVSASLPASPETIYRAWLDSGEHSKMTGNPAAVSDIIDGSFEAWDGYIQGKNLELEFPIRILQQWRTVEFEASEVDSILEVLLEEQGKGTKVTIHHSNLPDHGMQYQQGWIDAYFTPMGEYFSDLAKGNAG